MPDNLERIVDLCAAEVSVTINAHKSTYETVEGYLKVQEEEIDSDVLKVMIAMDKMVCVQAYPSTPIGFYVVYHYNIDMALSEMLTILMKDKDAR